MDECILGAASTRFIHSFLRSFICSFIRSLFAHSFVHSFAHSFTHSFVHSFIHSIPCPRQCGLHLHQSIGSRENAASAPRRVKSSRPLHRALQVRKWEGGGREWEKRGRYTALKLRIWRAVPNSTIWAKISLIYCALSLSLSHTPSPFASFPPFLT